MKSHHANLLICADIVTGDTPARQLEAGQQLGGAYPCICGIKDVLFGDIGLFNKKPPYMSSEQRLKVLELTNTWRSSAASGNLAPFEAMRVWIISLYYWYYMFTRLLST